MLSSTQKSRKPRFTFNPKRDIILLKSVLQNETWINHKWDLIVQNLKESGHAVTKSTVKNRCYHLLGLYKKQNLESIKRSGTEEDYDERATLLKEISDHFDTEVLIHVRGPDEIETVSSSSEDELLDLERPSTSTAATKVNLTVNASTPQNPSKKQRLDEKKKSDQLRDLARDALPQPTRVKKSAHIDTVDQKIKFDMDMKKKELELREIEEERKYDLRKKELQLEEDKQKQQHEIKKSELELENRRLEIASQTNNTNAAMFELMKEFLKNKN